MDARSHGACDRGGWGCAAAEPWGNRKRTGMRRALLVDDSPVLRSTVAQSLEQAGWSVSIASDAVEGLIAALSAPPDAVVNDLWMPVFSGLQLCQLLRGAAHDGANPRGFSAPAAPTVARGQPGRGRRRSLRRGHSVMTKVKQNCRAPASGVVTVMVAAPPA